MRRSMSSLWWRDSNQTASGKPGAVHPFCKFAKSVDEFLIGRTGNHGHDRGVNTQIGHLLADQNEIGSIAGHVNPIRLEGNVPPPVEIGSAGIAC